VFKILEKIQGAPAGTKKNSVLGGGKFGIVIKILEKKIQGLPRALKKFGFVGVENLAEC